MVDAGAQVERKNGWWWLILLLVCPAWCVIPIACDPKPEDALRAFPIGSKLTALDAYLGGWHDHSAVEQWIPDSVKGAGGDHTTTKYGGFFVKSVGTFEEWKASAADRDAFTGEIKLMRTSIVVPDDLDPSYMIILTYVDGVLREKDYGFLPG